MYSSTSSDDEEAMEANLLTDPSFDWAVFDRIVEIKHNLLNGRNVEKSLSYLSSTVLSISMLNTTMVEITIEKCAEEIPITFEPICGYLLRKWEKQREGKVIRNFKVRTLLPSRAEERTIMNAGFSEYKFHIMKRRKTYYFNKKIGVKSLKDLCRAKVQNSIHASVKRKSVVPLFSLLRRISPETLQKLEDSIPAVAEVSDRLWEAMLYLNFRGRNAPLALNNKGTYFFLLNQRRLFEEELNNFALSRASQKTVEKKEDVSIKRLIGRLIFYLADIFSS